MLKPKIYSGGDLVGQWEITLKIDGIRAFLDPVNGTATSRNGKPLYGLKNVLDILQEPMDAEIFCGSFKETMSILRASKSERRAVELTEVYPLIPLDPRLLLHTVTNPSEKFIRDTFNEVHSKGHEGLVLRQDNRWLKVKNTETFDVPVLALVEGQGQFKGCLGAFITPMGRVGTGFTHDDRKILFNESLIGVTIEVDCMSVTDKGKFRLPRFIRVRYDK